MSGRADALALASRAVNKARTKLIMTALGFVDLTLSEMDALEGTESSSAPAEFMLLHEAATEYRELYRKFETLADNG